MKNRFIPTAVERRIYERAERLNPVPPAVMSIYDAMMQGCDALSYVELRVAAADTAINLNVWLRELGCEHIHPLRIASIWLEQRRAAKERAAQ